MYLLDFNINKAEESSFSRVHEILRMNGCHSPSRDSITTFYRTLKNLIMLRKIQIGGGRAEDLNISILELLRMLNGPDAQLDITGKGYEFNGWYTEFCLFKYSWLMSMGAKSFAVTGRFDKEFLKAADNEQAQVDRLIDMFHKPDVFNHVRNEITSRIKEFNLVYILLEGVYTERVKNG